MASSTLAVIERVVRRHLGMNAGEDAEWTQDELMDLMNLAFRDLWRDILDLGEDYFQTVDASNVSQASSATTISGVPADVHRILQIEPRDLSAIAGLKYEPRPFAAPDILVQRALASAAPSAKTHYFVVHGSAAPSAAPTIQVSPKVSSNILLTMVYIATLATKVSTDTNPIPGESDQAVVAFTMAYALCKKSPDRQPDPKWIRTFELEKERLLDSLEDRVRQFGFDRKQRRRRGASNATPQTVNAQ